jgi:hypothetical protein
MTLTASAWRSVQQSDIAFNLGAERRDVAPHISVVRDLPDRQADPTVPLDRKQDDDYPRRNQDRQPDERIPGPQTSPRPRLFGDPLLRWSRRRQRRVAIGGQRLFRHVVTSFAGAGTEFCRFA